ncbi:MAG: glycosyltransferase, partial [Anaerolineae bacterium]|nr:glycosyltransferase [Anaerolineae bacterium]
MQANPKPLKILIITGIFPPDIGGPATYVPQIASELAKRGHEVTVLTLSDRLNHDDSMYPFNVVRLYRESPKPWRQIETVSSIIRLGRKADILFVNGLALETAVANKALRKPIIMKVVGDLVWERTTTWGWLKESFEEFQKKRYGLRIEILKALRTW